MEVNSARGMADGAVWSVADRRLVGKRSNPCSRNGPSAGAGGGLGPTTATCWKAFCGCCAAEHAGSICPRSFRRR